MNKKGFTLIELLSVIVILGIIIVIAVPSVISIVENIRKKSTTSAALLFYKSVDTCISSETDYMNCSNNSTLSKYYEGTLEKNDITIDNNGNITGFKYIDPTTNYGIALNKSKITKDDISKAEVMKADIVFAYDIVDDNTLKITSAYNTTFDDFKIQGNSSGLGTKTKNLFDITQPIIAVSNNGTLKYFESADGTYNLKGNLKLNGSAFYTYSGSVTPIDISSGTTITVSSHYDAPENTSVGIVLYDANGNIILQHNSTTNGSSITRTLTTDIASYGMVWAYRGTEYTTGDYFEINNIRLQLEIGSTASDYEPHNKYKIPVKVSGKNLINQDTNYSNNNNVSAIVEHDDYYDVKIGSNAGGIGWYIEEDFEIGDKISAQAKIEYVSTAGLKDSVTLRIWNDTKKVWIHAGTNGYNASFSTTKVGETTILKFNGVELTSNNYSKGDKIEFRVTRGMAPNSSGNNTINFKVYKDSIMLEKSNTSTEYESYIESSTHDIYLNEPLRSVDNYIDYIDFKNNKIVRNTRNLNLNIDNMNNSEGYPGWINVPNLRNDYPEQNKLFYQITSVNSNINKSAISINTLGNNSIIFITREILDLSQTQWKENYPNMNVNICYGLSSPIEETINLPDIPVYKGTTIINWD